MNEQTINSWQKQAIEMSQSQGIQRLEESGRSSVWKEEMGRISGAHGQERYIDLRGSQKTLVRITSYSGACDVGYV